MTKKVKLSIVETNQNEQILETISSLIDQDLDAIKDKIKDKPKQKKFILLELELARAFYKDNVLDAVNPKIEVVICAVERLQNATGSLTNYGLLSVAESLKISKYTRSILEIERNKRDELTFAGISDLSDQETLKRSVEVIKEKLGGSF